MGQRRAIVCKFDMLPPPEEDWRVEEESDRRVAGEVFFKKGHIALDCRRTVSMVDRIVRGLWYWGMCVLKIFPVGRKLDGWLGKQIWAESQNMYVAETSVKWGQL